ncbi:MAG: DUF4347 domain-containing protein, partial [Gammaproteobacteria bacterium]|nr:DUF4347 domain-containing protein [Gammaproteobacteria bacterium]
MIDDSQTSYPLTLDPQVVKLTAADGAASAKEQQTWQAEDTPAASLSQIEEPDEVADTVLTAEPLHKELVLVDTGTNNYQQLINDLLAQAGDSRHLEIVLLDSQRNGIDQISEMLLSYQGLDVIHLISHGNDGTINIGNTTLNSEVLAQNLIKIGAWSEALSDNGDLLIYGCDLAATDAGQTFIDTLANLTGADVAASDDPTGSVELGGDWDLEYRHGQIEAQTLLAQNSANEWHSLLTDIVLESNTPQPLKPTDTEVKDGQSAGQTFKHNSSEGTYEVNKIELVIYKAGDAASQNVNVTLRDAWDGTILGTTATTSSDTLAITETWVSFDIGTVTLTDNVEYYIRVEATGSDGKIYVGATDSDTYPNGSQINKDGISESGDVAFKIIDYIPPTTLALSKTAADVNGSLLVVGDEIRYTVQVTNTGSYTAYNVTVSDDLPVGVTYVSDSGGAATT